MALYYDAASVLSPEQTGGSLKSRIYNNTSNLKSKPAQLFALVSETAKRDLFLKEVIDNTDIVRIEPKLTPLLSLLLCHDHFFSKSGIAAPAKHPLRQAIERHKARLQAEFTRARLRRKCGSLDALKEQLDKEKGACSIEHPRWARINAAKIQKGSDAYTKCLSNYVQRPSISEVLTDSMRNSFYVDEHIPDLFAFSPSIDLTTTAAYKDGDIILQDKASCFPAHLLLGNESSQNVGDVIDGCAAPGNKTTHLAAIAHQRDFRGEIYACERDALRSKTLVNMVAKAEAAQVKVLQRQDFLALNHQQDDFTNVTHLLLDPSCSGSGILGRADIPQLALPLDPRAQSQTQSAQRLAGQDQRQADSKKRKRTNETNLDVNTARPGSNGTTVTGKLLDDTDVPVNPNEEADAIPTTAARLQRLSNLQAQIVEHAMKFPAATRITYSTCSIHEEENEIVVSRVLGSEIARSRGWRVLFREEQVEGLKKWKRRGTWSKGNGNKSNGSDTGNAADQDGGKQPGDGEGYTLSKRELEACIRCDPNDEEECTMGFFVCGFVREAGSDEESHKERTRSNAGRPGFTKVTEDEDQNGRIRNQHNSLDDEAEWEGFD